MNESHDLGDLGESSSINTQKKTEAAIWNEFFFAIKSNDIDTWSISDDLFSPISAACDSASGGAPMSES